MKKIHLIIALVLFYGALHSQTAIDFRLPSAAGLDYYYVLEKGSKQDTITLGKFDVQGNAQVVLPPEYATHRGVAKLLFAGNKSPMVNMILNNEKGVSVASGNANNFTFTHSPENETLLRFLKQQNELLQQYTAVRGEANGTNLMILDSKKRQIEQNYKQLSEEIDSTPLYAGRIIQIIRYLSFTGSSLGETNDEVTEELRNFIVSKLDFKDLYVSGFWSLLFKVWYENNITRSDSLLVADARTMLERTNSTEINHALSQSIINELSRYSQREYLLPAIFSNIKFPALGQAAPALINGSDSIVPRNALVLFFETGCGNCQNELHNLLERYDLLKGNAIRVITISADTNKDEYESTAAGFPWQDKLCDFKGFESKNFVNYGIFGTPTFILIDKDGIVRGRYAKLTEFLPKNN